MTIQELADLIRKEKNWAFEVVEDSVAFTLPTGPDRTHRVRLVDFRHENVDYVRFISVIGPSGSLEATRSLSALSINAHLVYGAVAVLRDQLILAETHPLGTIDATTAMLIISYLAQQADRYESVMFGDDVH